MQVGEIPSDKPHFRFYLRRQLCTAWEDFEESRIRLEYFEARWCGRTFEDPWKREANHLAHETHLAYRQLKQAWQQYQAEKHGLFIGPKLSRPPASRI